MITVKDILLTPPLRKLSVIGGEEGLKKRVSYVTVMEVPDITKWLKGNDFVITSLYAFKNDLKEQVNLIDRLADNNCSCLAVKIGEYVKELDKSVIERANLRGLVLVLIPREITYIDIIVNAMDKILDNRDIDYIIEKYMKDIIFNNIDDEDMVLERGNLLGFNIKSNATSVITLTSTGEDEKDKSRQDIRKLAKNVAKESDNIIRFSYNPVVTIGDKSSILLFSNEAKLIESNMSKIIELIEKNCTGDLLENIHIGVGPTKYGLEGLKDSYFKSIEALKIGPLLNDKSKVYYHKDINIYITLEKYLRSSGYELFEETFDKLDDDLFQTLESFYENNMDINLTAEKLFIHKNTVRYRLKKIKEITDYDPSKFEDNFKLYLFLIYSKIKKNPR